MRDARTAIMSGADATLNLGSQYRVAFFGRMYVMCMSKSSSSHQMPLKQGHVLHLHSGVHFTESDSEA